VLAILRLYGVTASFSMIGRNAAAFPEIARQVAAAGHMIVNRGKPVKDICPDRQRRR